MTEGFKADKKNKTKKTIHSLRFVHVCMYMFLSMCVCVCVCMCVFGCIWTFLSVCVCVTQTDLIC